MNYQNKPPQKVLDILKKHNVEYWSIDYYAYPETFGSTAGPREGIGGCAMSTFTVEAWVCDGSGPTVFMCAGMYCFDDSRWKPFKRADKWKDSNVV